MEFGHLNFSLRKTLFAAVLMTLATGIFGCSPVSFSAGATDGTGVTGGDTTTTGTETCNVETLYRKTKILFVVDTSGSNVDATYNIIGGQTVQTPATDPTKSFRGGAISDFLSDYSSKSNFQWSFLTFSGSSAVPYVTNGSNTPAFTTNVSTMTSALYQFYNTRDTGSTPYGAALTAAARAVSNDPDLNSTDEPLYFVVFLSDGFPTDYYSASGVYDSTAMNRDVANLVGVAPGRVLLSTVFYGQVAIPDAVTLLKSMASLGGGQFASVNTSSNTDFKIDDVIGTTNCSSN